MRLDNEFSIQNSFISSKNVETSGKFVIRQ